MARTWTAADLPELADPNVIDRIGHFMHANQGDVYGFDMPIMGYQVLYYDETFVALVKRETGLTEVRDLTHEVRRGVLSKKGEDGWEVSFRADAVIRNHLDPDTRKPIGAVDYASDLEYSGTVLYCERDDGLELFQAWGREHGLLG